MALRETSAQVSIIDRRRWALPGMVLAALLLGLAVQMYEGMYNPRLLAGQLALVLMAAALVVCVVGVIGAKRKPDPKLFQRPLTLLALAVSAQFVCLIFVNPGTSLNLGPGQGVVSGDFWSLWRAFWGFRLGVLAVALVVGLSLWRGGRWLNVGAAAVLIGYFLLGASVLVHNPNPHIDVFIFQQQSCSALLHGQNPYTQTFPNIYYPNTYVYGPGLWEGDRLNFGFPYQPLSLLMSLPGYLLAHDYRYSQLAAMVLTGVFLLRLGWTSQHGSAEAEDRSTSDAARRAALLGTALLLFTPRGFCVLELGWTEPYVVLMLAATLYCAARRPRWLPLALGLLFATKQYTILIAPLTLLLMPRPWSWRAWMRMMFLAGVVAAAVSGPLIVWDVRAYIHSVVTLQFHQPFRIDALSFLAGWNALTGVQLPNAIAFGMVIPATALVLWRCPRTPAGFAAAVALVYFAFLAFNKQAFCNYYFFVIAALCCSVAAAVPGRGPAPREEGRRSGTRHVATTEADAATPLVAVGP